MIDLLIELEILSFLFMWYNWVKDATLLLIVLYALTYGLCDIPWRHQSLPVGRVAQSV
jgi:hypothetical protein